MHRTDLCRRAVIGSALGAVLSPSASASAENALTGHRWYEAALAMRQRAESWGDQPYGAVLVLDGRLVGEGPSRVVLNRDPDAHAEREAIRDAQRRLGRMVLPGSVLYSTSRPCPVCQRAAAQAGVARMFYGGQLLEAGRP
jgi:tRNA(Arg) A34 adenosine deaminase TadA